MPYLGDFRAILQDSMNVVIQSVVVLIVVVVVSKKFQLQKFIKARIFTNVRVKKCARSSKLIQMHCFSLIPNLPRWLELG